MKSRHRVWRLPLALLIGASSLFGLGIFVGSAHAIIGRPLTPVSYAGVARRSTRRAVYAAPVVAYPRPVVAAPVVVAPAPAVVW
ncbi:MAG: hypothetical protein JWM53_882 [bacterium]|nr:hypothetical protein [bacterium]